MAGLISARVQRVRGTSMTDYVQNCCGNIKTIAAETQGTPTQKLIAILRHCGVETTADLAAIIGVGERAIQKANSSSVERTTVREPQFGNEPEFAKNEPQFANSSSDASRVDNNNIITLPVVRPVEVITPLPPKAKRKPKANGPTPYEALQAFEAYNAVALRCGLRQASKLTKDRQRKVIARLSDFGLEGWNTALAHIERTPFLRGANERGWKATFDFMLQASSFAKLHDGTYGNDRQAYAKPPAIRNNDPKQGADLDQFVREYGLCQQ
jgi:hypothetical protein